MFFETLVVKLQEQTRKFITSSVVSPINSVAPMEIFQAPHRNSLDVSPPLGEDVRFLVSVRGRKIFEVLHFSYLSPETLAFLAVLLVSLILAKFFSELITREHNPIKKTLLVQY